jgi:hypothetical protein
MPIEVGLQMTAGADRWEGPKMVARGQASSDLRREHIGTRNEQVSVCDP